MTARRAIAYRAAIPAAGLVLLGVFAALWVGGFHQSYFAALNFLFVEPFAFPFLDAHQILAAADCHRQGVDVYIANPCNVLSRRFDYSPLWLSLLSGFIGARDTPVVGLGLEVAFILSLAALFRPRSLSEIALFAGAAFSPTVFFALERANFDILVFLLVLGASLLLGARSVGRRFAAYSLFLFAGLLKYYPLVLLVTIGRERRRAAALAVLGAAAALIAFILIYRGEILTALVNIPRGSYFDEAFWALNLPYGVAELVGQPPRSPLAASLLIVLVVAALLQTRRLGRLLSASNIDWREPDARCLAAASLIVPACFFASQNVGYRGVFLLLAIPGLLDLRASASNPPVRRWAGRMIAALVFVMWAKMFRHELQLPWPSSITLPIWIGLWLVRELVWWWLVAGLLALAMVYSRDLAPAAQLFAAAGRRLRAAGLPAMRAGRQG